MDTQVINKNAKKRMEMLRKLSRKVQPWLVQLV